MAPKLPLLQNQRKALASLGKANQLGQAWIRMSILQILCDPNSRNGKSGFVPDILKIRFMSSRWGLNVIYYSYQALKKNLNRNNQLTQFSGSSLQSRKPEGNSSKRSITRNATGCRVSIDLHSSSSAISVSHGCVKARLRRALLLSLMSADLSWESEIWKQWMIFIQISSGAACITKRQC